MEEEEKQGTKRRVLQSPWIADDTLGQGSEPRSNGPALVSSLVPAERASPVPSSQCTQAQG